MCSSRCEEGGGNLAALQQVAVSARQVGSEGAALLRCAARAYQPQQIGPHLLPHVRVTALQRNFTSQRAIILNPSAALSL